MFNNENDRIIMYGGTIGYVDKTGKVVNKKIYSTSERLDVTDIVESMEKDRKLNRV